MIWRVPLRCGPPPRPSLSRKCICLSSLLSSVAIAGDVVRGLLLAHQVESWRWWGQWSTALQVHSCLAGLDQVLKQSAGMIHHLARLASDPADFPYSLPAPLILRPTTATVSNFNAPAWSLWEQYLLSAVCLLCCSNIKRLCRCGRSAAGFGHCGPVWVLVKHAKSFFLLCACRDCMQYRSLWTGHLSRLYPTALLWALFRQAKLFVVLFSWVITFALDGYLKFSAYARALV